MALRVDLKQVNKRVFENLIKSGACDELGERAVLLGNYESITDQASSIIKERENGQLGLFGSENQVEALDLDPEKMIMLSTQEQLKNEKALLGLYLSGHPLQAFKNRIEKLPFSIEQLTPEDENKRVTLIGILSETRRIVTKTKREMVAGILEDLSSSIEIVLFSSDKFDSLSPHFQDDSVVQVNARVRVSQDSISLICDNIEPLHTNDTKKLYIDTENIDNPALYKQLRSNIIEHRGSIPIIFYVGEKRVQAHEKYGIDGKEEILEKIEKIVGQGHYWVV